MKLTENRKNRYIVVEERSHHANWLSAEANYDTLIKLKKRVYILFDGEVVYEDVKTHKNAAKKLLTDLQKEGL